MNIGCSGRRAGRGRRTLRVMTTVPCAGRVWAACGRSDQSALSRVEGLDAAEALTEGTPMLERRTAMSRLPRNYLLGFLAGLLLLLVASVAPAPPQPSPKPSPRPSPPLRPSPVLRGSAPAMTTSPSPAPPTFAGAALPTPPQQTSPWTPPAGLPGPLVSAATTLFDQGLADPRGGDYRQVSVAVGNVWSGDGGVARTHAWVLPVDTPGGQRFAVCWNGLVYPAAIRRRPGGPERRRAGPGPSRRGHPRTMGKGEPGGAVFPLPPRCHPGTRIGLRDLPAAHQSLPPAPARRGRPGAQVLGRLAGGHAAPP